jgi:hypothetical protein
MRYIEEGGLRNRITYRINDRTGLRQFIKWMRTIGGTHAAFDFPANPNQRHEAGRIIGFHELFD